MAITNGAATRKHSRGTLNEQLVDFSIASGATSGTITAPSLTNLYHIVLGSSAVLFTAAPTYSGNVATFAFTVPASTAATLTLGGVTYTAVATDNTGNLINVAYTGGATAGSEVVTVTGKAISVQIESGVSSITQVRTAVNASVAAAALVTASGTSATAVSTASASFLTGGITGGTSGTAICRGR